MDKKVWSISIRSDYVSLIRLELSCYRFFIGVMVALRADAIDTDCDYKVFSGNP